MTSLEHKLRQIQDFLAANPNASVRVKFHGSDAVRNFPSHTVTNDTLSDTTETGVVFEDLDPLENDTRATLERHLCFSEWFKINNLSLNSDTRATLLGLGVAGPDPATAEPHTSPPLGGRMDAGDAPTVDWADLGERDFEKALQSITSVDELNGLANRRRVLRHDFKKWNEAQIGLILNRKFILENKNG